MVVIYEALTTAGSRRSSLSYNNGPGSRGATAAAVRLMWNLLWVGPHHLVQSLTKLVLVNNNKNDETHHYDDYGSNERAVVLRNVLTSWLTSGGLCWIIVWVVRNAAAARRRHQQPQGSSSTSTGATVEECNNNYSSSTAAAVVVVVEWLQSIVWTAWRKRSDKSGKCSPSLPLRDGDDDPNETRTELLHKGACHCGAVQFQVSDKITLLLLIFVM